YETVIVYEHRTEKAHIITMNMDDASEIELDKRIQRIAKQLDQHIAIPDPEDFPVHFEARLSKEDFMENVEKAKQYIASGEAAQIVLSQQMKAEVKGDPFSIYRQLRTANPSPYMFYIDFCDYLIIGASPESLVQTSDRQVITNPIAGTRPRGNTTKEDATLQNDLLADVKEIQEHDMLVDLSKTDLSTICSEDTIHVPVYKDIVKYEHVMH